MDLSGNPELQQIFREEVAERATHLVDGARLMEQRDLSPAEVVDRRRDAHTIKGNALVMGYPHMADAAKLLEDLLRDIEGGQRSQSPQLGMMIGRVAAQLSPAVEAELAGPPELLDKAADRLRVHLGLAPVDPDPTDGGAPDDVPGSSEPSPPTVASAETGESPNTDNVFHLLGELGAPLEEPANLGGLVEALESQMVSEVTRVESANLYRLINRIVELRLDAQVILDEFRGSLGREPRPVGEANDWEHSLLRLDQSARSLEEEALELASAALVEVTRSFSQLVTFLGRRTGKEIRLEVIGEEVAVDRQIIDALREPLRHLIVNAVDHGIEMPHERVGAGKPATATLLLRAHIESNLLTITVSDDGRGINWEKVRAAGHRRSELRGEANITEAELTRLLFSEGFSTVDVPGDISGDGAGLASVAELVQGLNGSMSLESSPEGTAISMTLPSSLALQHVLVVEAAGKHWGIPETSVLGVHELLEPISEFEFGTEQLPVRSFAEAVGVPEDSEPGAVVALATRSGSAAFSVCRVVGTRRVAVKALGPLLTGAPHFSGAAFLGGGEVVVVVAPDELAERAGSQPADSTQRPYVLVVDDSRGVRQLIQATLSSDGFEVSVAEDATAALDALASGRFEALVVDYRLPGSDGVEVVAAVRRMFPHMPIVMVSAVADADDQTRALAAGVDAYLDKSDFRQGVLATTLRSLLSGAASRGEVAR